MSVFESLKGYGNIYIMKDKSPIAVDMTEMHYHDCHELYFLLSGVRRYFIGHTIYNVASGNMLIIPKNELHRTTARNNNGYERYVVYFYDDYINDIADNIDREALNELMSGCCIQFPVEHLDYIRRSLQTMELEMSLRKPYYETVTKNLFCNIIVMILRYGQKKSPVNSADANRIQEIAQYISENYASEITLGSAAQMVFMEKTHFSKKFKYLTGFGFNEYLTQTRIKAASELLALSDMTISEVSEHCGFSSSNYFGDVFKRIVGVSPSVYRKTMLGISNDQSDL